jgi:HD-like signal output (HDOD) protein
MSTAHTLSLKPSPEQLQQAIRRMEHFSPAPRILARALVMMRDDRCDLLSLAELIRGDPALSADILRIANSAYFGIGLMVESVEHALHTIGYREATRMLNLAVSRSLTHINLDSYCITAEDFWAESLFNGLFMETLANATGGADPAEAYTAGLLRYVGRLAINRGIEELGGGLYWIGTEPLAIWEQKNVGFTHSQAGTMLLEHWHFPVNLIEGCRGQESPALLRKPSWLASALYFAASVLPQDFDQVFNPVLTPTVNSDFLHPNGLTSDAVATLFTETHANFLKMRERFTY